MVYVTSNDITQRKRAEDSLRKSEMYEFRNDFTNKGVGWRWNR